MNVVLKALAVLAPASRIVRAQTVSQALEAIEKRDYPGALNILRLPAEQGNAKAQYSPGVMLLGLPEAQYRVGRRYFIGHGITQSYPKAAEQVDAEARARIKALVNEQGNRQ